MKWLKNVGAAWAVLIFSSCSMFVAGTSEEENTIVANQSVDVVDEAGDSVGASSSSYSAEPSGSNVAKSSNSAKSDVEDSQPQSSPAKTPSSSAASGAISSSETSVSVKSSNSAADGSGGYAWGCYGGNSGGFGGGGLAYDEGESVDGRPDPGLVYDSIYDYLVGARAAKLVADGKNDADAEKQANAELYKIFGIDVIEAKINRSMVDMSKKRTVAFVLKNMDSSIRTAFDGNFVSSGTADENDLCWIFERGRLDYLGASISDFMPIGCAVDDYMIGEPTLILNSIWFRCGNVPDCDASRQNTLLTVEATASRKALTLVCRDMSWSVATLKDLETAEHPCTKNGEWLQSDSLGYITYVCHEGVWYASNENTEYLPAEYFMNPDFSYGTMTDVRDGQVYKTTQFLGKTWLAQNINYYDKDDPVFMKSSMCLSEASKGGGYEEWTCEKNGRYYRDDAAHKACPDGWRLPTKNDWSEINDMEYAPNYMTKLFSKISGIRNATDDFGLSLRLQNLIDAYGWYSSGLSYAFFWVEESEIVAVSSTFSSYRAKDSREQGQFAPVRCVKD